MALYKFEKYQALGNDYIVLDPRSFDIPLTKPRIRRLCDRHFGIGSDGILFGPTYTGDTPTVRIYNPDGSEAEKSGNGVRIFAKYVFDHDLKDVNSFDIMTKGGVVSVSKNNPDSDKHNSIHGAIRIIRPESHSNW